MIKTHGKKGRVPEIVLELVTDGPPASGTGENLNQHPLDNSLNGVGMIFFVKICYRQD